jgi:hypothetical protein
MSRFVSVAAVAIALVIAAGLILNVLVIPVVWWIGLQTDAIWWPRLLSALEVVGEPLLIVAAYLMNMAMFALVAVVIGRCAWLLLRSVVRLMARQRHAAGVRPD